MTAPTYVTGSALGDLDMILHDISQYLTRSLGSPEEVTMIDPPWVNSDDGGLVITDQPDELLRRAKMVKDLAIRCAGGKPLQWGGFELNDNY